MEKLKLDYLTSLVENVKKIAKDASEIFVNAHEHFNINEKLNAKDFVTDYDKKTQEFIENALSSLYKDANFLGEEDAVLCGDESTLKGKFFIIDPIDGTANFVYGLRHSCISIGYAEDGVVLAGVVYNPYIEETFYAIKGQGAYKNGKRLQVNNKLISQGLVGFGTAVYYDELIEKTKKVFGEILVKANDLRRMGTAAIDLCYVAEGRFCGFFETRLCPWDYSVGILMILEAGGLISDFYGNPLPLTKRSSVVAGNPTAYDELFNIVKEF